MRPHTAVIAVLLLAALHTANADIVTIATLNVENFFDAHDDPYRRDEGTRPKADESQRLLAMAIKELDADLLALQEVESREVLEQFNRERLAGMYAHVVCLEGNDGRGIDVALLSKLPVTFAASYQHRRWPPVQGIPYATGFARDVLRVRIQATDQTPLELLVLHLKSKGGGVPSDHWREREAREVRAIVQEIVAADPDVQLAVLGDFNYLPNAPPLSPLFDPNAQPRLIDVTKSVPLIERWSFIYKEAKQQLDYLLVNQALHKNLAAGSVRFTRPPEEAADHSALTAKFDLPGTAERRNQPLPPWVPLAVNEKPDTEKAIPATDTEAVKAKLGHWAVVRGRISRVYWSPTGKVCYLNFDGVDKSAFSGVVFEREFGTFPHLRSLNGRNVVVQGVVSEYEGNVQMVLNDAGQLVVLD